MHILMVGSARSVHVTNRARALRAAGATVTLLSNEASTHLSDDLNVISPTPSGGGRNLIRYLRFARLLRRTPADIVFVHFASGLPAWISLLDPRPLAVSLMGSDVSESGMQKRSRFSRRLTKRLIRNADLVTAKSSRLVRRASEYGAASERVIEVLWGIDPSDFRQSDAQSIRTQLGISPAATVIFSPRPLKPNYQIDLLVEAFPEIARRLSDCYLLVAEHNANQAFKGRLVERVRELGMEDRVLFVGDILPHDIAAFYANSDVTLSLSLQDGFPQCILESMAAGCPCVVGRITDLEAVLTDRQVRFTEFDVNAIADSVTQLATDSQQRASLISGGDKLVDERANLGNEAGRVLKRLEQAVAHPRNRKPSALLVVFELVAASLVSRLTKTKHAAG